MPDLQTLQDEMVAAMLGGDMAQVASELTQPAWFSIYRNNSFISLTEALKAKFPVVVKLADERFFAYAAHCFIAAQPPREARLAAYGGAFPRFLARFAASRGFPLLAEMASLEWAIAQALDAPDLGIDAGRIREALAAAGGDSLLTLQPSLRFVVSRYPLLDVWSSHQGEPPSLMQPLEGASHRIAIHRRGDAIHFIALEGARFAFWRALTRGRSLAAGLGLALNREAAFDLATELALLFRSGLVTGVVSNRQTQGDFS